MALSIPVRPRVITNKYTVITRKLLGTGSLNVQKNEEVAPHTILGEYTLSGGFSVVEIAQRLGVSPKEGKKYLQRALGSKIFKGELLAQKKGFLSSKTIVAPTDGILQSYNEETGELQLTFLTKMVHLTSGVFGIVQSVDQNTGEVGIKTLVTEIHGVVGLGKERSGIIHVLGSKDSLIQVADIKEDLSQRIIVGGALAPKDALRQATTLRVQGLVLGGIHYQDFKAMGGVLDPKVRLPSDVGISVIATEGFGPTPIGEDIFSIISSHNTQFAFIDGSRGVLTLPSTDPNSVLSLRKVELPATLKNEGLILKNGELALNSKVRIVWSPNFALQGVVMGIEPQQVTLESGVQTYMVNIQTQKQQLKVPYQNLELI